ncbi:hypothetical protein KJ966_31770 [bacterium]|nr:hypothetical protein [bacterium]
MIQWSKNDSLFKKELEEGFKYQLQIAEILQSNGIEVSVPKLRFRESIKDITEFSNEPDLIWGDKIFEVKSRNLSFTNVDNFPFESILVDTVNGWNSKEKKPDAYLCISKKTNSIICLSGKTFQHWEKKKERDHIRKIEDIFYFAAKKYWIDFEAFLQVIRNYSYLLEKGKEDEKVSNSKSNSD